MGSALAGSSVRKHASTAASVLAESRVVLRR
jgi:hypothetical protein